MNILFYFIHQIRPQDGGVERVTDILARAFIEQGHHVCFLSKYQAGPAGDIPTFFLPETDAFDSPANVAFLQQLLQEQAIDLVIHQGPNTDEVALINRTYIPQSVKLISCLHMSVYLPPRYYLDLHRIALKRLSWRTNAWSMAYHLLFPILYLRQQRKIRKMIRQAYHNSDALLFLSPEYVCEAKEIQEDIEHKMITLLNPNSYEGVERGQTERKKEILFVGRVQYAAKRIDRLIKLWAKIGPQYPDWQLTVVGDGSERAFLQTKYQHIANVAFVGQQDPSPYYQRAKLLTITSSGEGCPMVIPEAMIHGVIPITFDCFSAAPSMIDHEKNGFIVPSFDMDCFEQTLRQAMEMPDEAMEQMSASAHEKASRVTKKDIIKQWEDVFARVMPKQQQDEI